MATYRMCKVCGDIHDGHINGDRNELKLGSRALIYTRADLGHDFGNWSLAFRVEHLSNANLGNPIRKDASLWPWL